MCAHTQIAIEQAREKDKLMANTILHHRRLVVIALAVALALAVVVVLPRASSAAPPEPVDVTVEIPGCEFPVLAEVSGKSKEIDLPSGKTLFTSPGLRITLTNLEELENQVTYVITGSFLATEQADGNFFVVARGRNLIFGPDVGMFLTIGRFTFVGSNADGVFVALTPPTGEGRLIDVCALLE
jgi:hypothetical protein